MKGQNVTSSIIAVPTATRPELLALCLQRLAVANRNYAFDVNIYADCVANLGEVEVVRDLYLPEAFIFSARPHPPAFSGSWNILQAIKHAAASADTVYLVEEDVGVYPYFFDWHGAQMAPVSLGRRTVVGNFHQRFPKAYRNPGSCLRRPVLDLLVPHINDDYYRDQKAYCDAQGFPTEKYGPVDDGLICYVIEKAGMGVAIPDEPICAHQGFFYYNQLDIYMNHETEIGKKIERIKQIHREIETSPDPRHKRYGRDFEPFLPR